MTKLNFSKKYLVRAISTPQSTKRHTFQKLVSVVKKTIDYSSSSVPTAVTKQRMRLRLTNGELGHYVDVD